MSFIKKIIEATAATEEMVSDSDMKVKIDEVVSILDGYKNNPIDESMIKEVLKIQALAKEIQL